MTFPARLRSWARAVFRRTDLNREIADELEFHVARYVDDLERRGLPPAEARRRARAELGSVDARRDECRQQLGLRLLDELRGDTRYALRLFRRSPGFAAVAILSLGLGIGANTAIFSLVDAVLLETLPVSRPQRLFFVDDSGGKSNGSNGPPYPCYEIMRDGARQFSGLAMFAEQRFRVELDGTEEEVRGQYVSGNYFDVLGVPAVHGRALAAADDARGGSGGPDGPVVVISYRFWKERFGLSPSVLGRRIRVDTKPMTIVGVTPPGFFGLTVGAPVDVTVPVTLSTANLSTRASWWFSVVGRLADGAAVEPARAELDAMFQRYMTALRGHPPAASDYFNRVDLVPASRGLDEIRRPFSTPLTIVMAIVGVVLVIGCANVANLLLARASARQDEMALRFAIGAGRARLVRQLVTEGAILAALGAAAGIVAAYWGVHLLVDVIGATRQQIDVAPTFGGRVLGFTTAVAALTALLCSVLPALDTTRVAGAGPGAPGRTSPSAARRRIGRALVVVQVTLSVALLSGAALFIRTLQNLERVDAGFRAGDVLVAPVEVPLPKATTNDEQAAALARAAADWSDLAVRIGALPGVRAAAVANLSPMSGRDRGVNVTIVGGPPLDEADRAIHLNLVTSELFETLGMRLVAGRFFRPSDSADGVKVAVISDAAARAYFGQASPLGRSIRINTQPTAYAIVGVVHDARYESLREPGSRMAYLPMVQAPGLIGKGMFNSTLVVRAVADPAAVARSLREQVRRTVPGSFVANVTGMNRLVDGSLLQERLVSALASLFGLLALALASIGLYGLLSYAVVQRTREFGVRIAVGAPRGRLIWMVLREVCGLVAAAVACGVAIVLALGGYIRTVLFEVSPADPLAIGGAMAILVLVAVAASYLPARRASRISPMAALRQE